MSEIWRSGYLRLALGAVCLALSGGGNRLSAQQPYEGEYIRFVPLSYPRLVSQTEANAFFDLYGDAGDPAYRDVDPLNGIDDSRDLLLTRLGERFAPILIQNTAAIPLDFKVFSRLTSEIDSRQRLGPQPLASESPPIQI